MSRFSHIKPGIKVKRRLDTFYFLKRCWLMRGTGY